MGVVNRGADLSWLSQYPGEMEVLFPPMTGEPLTTTMLFPNRLLAAAWYTSSGRYGAAVDRRSRRVKRAAAAARRCQRRPARFFCPAWIRSFGA